MRYLSCIASLTPHWTCSHVILDSVKGNNSNCWFLLLWFPYYIHTDRIRDIGVCMSTTPGRDLSPLLHLHAAYSFSQPCTIPTTAAATATAAGGAGGSAAHYEWDSIPAPPPPPPPPPPYTAPLAPPPTAPHPHSIACCCCSCFYCSANDSPSAP